MILDCTLRDGGYVNNWRFSEKFMNEYFALMNILPMAYLEVGFINNKKEYKKECVGDVRNLTKLTIEKFKKLSNHKLCVMGDYGDVNLELLKKGIDVEIIRIAFHKKDMAEALKVCGKIKQMGYKVSANAMAIVNYNATNLCELNEMMINNNIDILCVADSYGCMSQRDMFAIVKFFKENNKNNYQIGVHLHNNKQNAFSNFEYLRNVFDNRIIFDGTLFGIGRGAGNLMTESMIMFEDKEEKIDAIKMLNFIQNNLKEIYNTSETSWGYELDFLLSGHYKIHPNYVCKMREIKIRMNDRLQVLKKIKDLKKGEYFDMNIIVALLSEIN